MATKDENQLYPGDEGTHVTVNLRRGAPITGEVIAAFDGSIVIGDTLIMLANVETITHTARPVEDE